MDGNVFISPVNCFPPHSASFVLLKYNSLYILVKVGALGFGVCFLNSVFIA